MAHRITWDRFCCGHNKKARNKPADQRVEHVNRPCERHIKRLGLQNASAKLLKGIGCCVLSLHDATEAFDKRTHITRPSALRSGARRPNHRDEDIILRILLAEVNS